MGYEWDGMKKLSWEEVKEAHEKHYLDRIGCFFLYDDGTEAQFYDYEWSEIEKHHLNGGEFGIEAGVCAECGKKVAKTDMTFTKDCHGISFRHVCHDCYMKLMAKGYDGEYYTEADEQIEDDY